jgi:hypothetical protein
MFGRGSVPEGPTPTAGALVNALAGAGRFGGGARTSGGSGGEPALQRVRFRPVVGGAGGRINAEDGIDSGAGVVGCARKAYP